MRLPRAAAGDKDGAGAIRDDPCDGLQPASSAPSSTAKKVVFKFRTATMHLATIERRPATLVWGRWRSNLCEAVLKRSQRLHRATSPADVPASAASTGCGIRLLARVTRIRLRSHRRRNETRRAYQDIAEIYRAQHCAQGARERVAVGAALRRGGDSRIILRTDQVVCRQQRSGYHFRH